MRRRKRNGNKEPEEQSFWQSYSDMMAALLLVFVLLIVVASRNVKDADEIKQQNKQIEAENERLSQLMEELKEKLEEALQNYQNTSAELEEKESELDELSKNYEAASNKLQEKESELSDLSKQYTTATNERDELADQLQNTLDEFDELSAERDKLSAERDALSAERDQQEEQLRDQKEKIDNIIGIRKDIIEKLQNDFEDNTDMNISIDPETGTITFDSNVLFDKGSHKLKPEGEEFLDKFFPEYFNILLSDDIREYIAEIVIEGHTDSSGTYLHNVDLSQKRAFAVVNYCLGEESDMFKDQAVRDEIRKMVTANGRAYFDLKYDENGNEDADASRRVEVKFRLTEQEMIAQVSEILEN